ncbi:polysaccharide deacetylase family protein [Paenibacillus sp. IB182496]|uniref:Polysaccharide deacetylase family protein n=1 Tax=Paenibacillus sabuli TaxID=2772509 RepID=A0A927BQS0_9BACL|nr:polysaccharide deacetylase family protein [Paenibacillus sabuli]MBD2844537.1 polysaccharide deacetylase family protein [Paenibacillus sabuli]
MENLLLWSFYILTFYAFLPGIISRTFGFRVFKKGVAKREIALTFDDGPDPVYTRQLLDLLAEYKAKATFFVVGANAERHPELLQRMHQEGHTIGIHNYVHKSNWLMRPKTVRKQIHRTAAVIRKATGLHPIYYRPPWGIVNLFDFSNLGYLQIILWSSMFNDWRKRVGVGRLTKRMLRKLRPGEVLLLHDCGSTLGADADAPQNMLAALRIYLQEGDKRGFRFVTIKEMIAATDKAREAKGPSVFQRMLVALWLGWEKLFHLLFRLQAVDGGEAIFYYRVRPYKGPTLQLANGLTVRPSDPVIELHFDNSRLLDIMRRSRSIVQVALLVIREVEQALPKLGAHLAGRPEYRDIRALYGISMINRGSEAFGFKVIDLPGGLFSRLTGVYLKLLLRILHPSGRRRLNGKSDSLAPKIIAMGIDEFRSRYEPGARGSGGASSIDPAVSSRTDAKIKSSARYENEKAARGMTP